jgi:hypothetical protein
MKLWLDDLPDPPLNLREDGLWSCHAISRAIKYKWSLQGWMVVDGWFHTSQHSWLEYTDVALDTYPVASLGGPLLVDLSFWRKLYRPDSMRFSAKDLQTFDQHAGKLLSMASIHEYRRNPNCKIGVCSTNNCLYPECTK